VANLRHPELAQSGDNRPPPISRSAPVAAFLIMSTRSIFIGSTLTLIRTLRLSMCNPLQGSDTTISMGGGISRNATWIQRCPKTIGVQACYVNGHVKRSLPGFRVNLLVAKGLYREAESPLSTAAAIPRSKLTLPCMSRLINAIVGSVSRIRTPTVNSSTIGVEKQRALVITAMTMPKIGTEARTTAKTRIGIGTRDLSETQEVVAETLHKIVAAIPERESGRSQEARGGFAGQEGQSRHKGKAPRILSSSNAGSIRQL
jgi:hypothetical protein